MQPKIDLGLEEPDCIERGETCSQQQMTKDSMLLLTLRMVWTPTAPGKPLQQPWVETEAHASDEDLLSVFQ